MAEETEDQVSYFRTFHVRGGDVTSLAQSEQCMLFLGMISTVISGVIPKKP